MSDETLFDGHRVDGCRGRWINVGTLKDPFRQMCNTCRAARQKPFHDDDDDQDIVDMINAADVREARGFARLQHDLEVQEFEESLQPRYPTSMQMLGGCLIVLALGAAIGIIVFVKVTGGHF